jgi:glycosyltransferase involved in cell wall biosynthesis
MNTSSELTIVIPAKNEAILLPRLLESLVQQDYQKMATTRILVADAGSTDDTREVAAAFRDRLAVEIIEGGLPAVGRNAGAALATTPYVLFLDADVELADRSLIRRALARMTSGELHCLTTNIRCRGSLLDKALYAGNNFFQHLSRLYRPFSTGMFMLFDLPRFRQLGGFNERALFAEDYLLSQKVARRKFAVVLGGVFTTNRRFSKMGYFRVVSLFLSTAWHTHSEGHFLKDHGYWSA